MVLFFLTGFDLDSHSTDFNVLTQLNQYLFNTNFNFLIMKTLNSILAVCLSTLMMVSCSSDDSPAGNVSIKAKATYTNPISAKLASNVVLNSFIVNLKEIEFELDESHLDETNQSYDDNGYYDSEDEIKLKGPFQLDLLNVSTPLTFVDLPNGKYEEVEFKMAKDLNAGSSMYGKSIQIKGTIDGTPFVFWHTTEEDFEVDFEDMNQDVVVTDGTITVNINFDLNIALSGIDFSSANDGDGDGVIEIGPDDMDGNHDLADLIKEKIKDATDLDN